MGIGSLTGKATATRGVGSGLREMFMLDGRSWVVTSAVIATRNLPEPQKAKNQPLGWFF